MDLAQSFQDFIQTGRSFFTALKWLVSLTGSRAPEFRVDRRVVWTFFLVATLVFIAPWLPVAITNFGCA